MTAFPFFCVALDLPCAALFTTSTEKILENVQISVNPNPAQDVVMNNTGDKMVSQLKK